MQTEDGVHDMVSLTNLDAKSTGWGALQKLSGLWSIYHGAWNQLLSSFVFSCIKLNLNTLQNNPAHFT